MCYSLQPIDEGSARAVLSWRYETPYSVYNADPAALSIDLSVLLNPANGYYGVCDGQGELVAYRCFGPDARVPGGDYAAMALDTGGGLRPDLTGQGQGLGVLLAGLDYARTELRPAAFRVTVAQWNVRAQRVCERAGFRPVQTFEARQNGTPFVVLWREV